jgi:hypothetical protein
MDAALAAKTSFLVARQLNTTISMTATATLDLTETGALFALHHGAGKKRRSAHRNRASALKIIRNGGRAPEIWAVRKTKTENICFT